MDNAVYELIARFNSTASEICQLLGQINTLISDGKIPESEAVKRIDTSINDLQKTYDEIFALTKENVNEQDIPSYGSSINDFKNAIESSKDLLLQKKVDELTIVINKFLAVKTALSNNPEELIPYKDVVQDLKNTLLTLSFDNINEIENKSQPSRDFIEMIENPDPDDSVVERITEHFSPKIVFNLGRRNYLIGEDIFELLMKEGANPESKTEYTEDNVQEVIQTDVKESDNTSNNADSTQIKKTLSSVNKPKVGVTKVAAFKSELDKIGNQFTNWIIPIMSHFGIITEEQIKTFASLVVPNNVLQALLADTGFLLNRLADKGYVLKFEPDNEVSFYCLSKYTYSCIHKDSLKRDFRWLCKVGDFSITMDNESKIDYDLANNVLLDNTLLMKYLSLVNEHQPQLMGDIQGFIKRKNDTYRVKAIIEDTEYDCELYNGRNIISDMPIIVVPAILPYEDKLGEVIICDESGIRFKDGKTPLVYEKNNEIETTESEKTSVENKQESDLNVPQDMNQAPITSELENVVEEALPIVKIENEKKQNNNTIQESHNSERVVSPHFDDNAFEKDTPDEDAFIRMIEGIINVEAKDVETIRSSVVNGVVMAKAASFIYGYSEIVSLYKQLLYATDLPLDDRQYSSASLSNVYRETSNANECLLMSTYLFTLTSPKRPYDFGVSAQADLFLHEYNSYFPNLSSIKPLFNKLISIWKDLPSGFTDSIVVLLSDEVANDKYLNSIRNKAKEYLTVPNPNTRMKMLKPLYHSLFGEKSDLYKGLKIVSENDAKEIQDVKIALLDFCIEENDTLIIDDSMIDDFINKAWYKENPGNKFDLDYVAKKRVVSNANQRIAVLKNWYDFQININNRKIDLNRLRKEKAWIVTEVQKALDKLSGIKIPYINVLKWMLIHIKQYISGTVNNLWIFNDFLCSGIFVFDDNRVPIIDSECNDLKYFEPWRNMQKHINSTIHDLKEAKKCINEKVDSVMFDNINQLKLINTVLGDTESIDDEDTRTKKAQDLEAQFREKLELAYLYNQISEVEKESISQIIDQHRELYYSSKDYGCWKQFLQALKEEINELGHVRQMGFKAYIEELISDYEKNEIPPILLEAYKLVDKSEGYNLAFVEELLNRYNAGELDFSEEWKVTYEEENEFKKFISDGVFMPLYEECSRGKDRVFRNFAPSLVLKHKPAGWTKRLVEESEAFVKTWPMRNEKTGNNVLSLFEHLGFNVTSISKRIPLDKGDRYQLYVKPTPLGLSDYSHPISGFGTQMKSPFDIVILHGGYSHKEIVDRITALDLGGMAIVLLDYAFTITERRQLSEYFHTQTSRQNPFILIDQTLFLYLALHQKTERIPVMLSCTLPFTTYQPFVRDGGSTSNEMFFGRVKELSTIIDPNGAVVVYGGRQLGKTALLQRAEKRCMDPDKKAYAVYVSVLDCNTELRFVSKIIKETNKKLINSDFSIPDCTSLESFAEEIEKLIRDEKIDKLWLFIDEVDEFLSSISKEGYKQLNPFIELKRNYSNQFKYVLAGLHNVCRAKQATENNGVFGQVGAPLCIKPLSPSDAIQLLLKPLSYLGFEIERLPHLATIITKSNSYPGILQFFGYTLVQTLTSNYTKYYQANRNNPPFPLKEEHLGSVMDSADLNASIKEKFKLTLDLDPRYFMLARCIAFRYHFEDDNNRWHGYDVESIMEIAEEYNIHCLENHTKKEYTVLLDEMVEMGILSSQNETYRLRKKSFIDLIGRDLNKVDEEIRNNNVGA